ncbi:zinc ribbon domain-containing protein [Cupriavidus sp. BIC8F]|uniref:zinc ribbon domain-containing protein n=1 Tax=Cupriavidus sp. BIC8F TaxID=3079014 RepID=UPI002916D9CE|nr:zinc ribbon domain-containing protein [Cupriavidus sp. BIC8F]
MAQLVRLHSRIPTSVLLRQPHVQPLHPRFNLSPVTSLHRLSSRRTASYQRRFAPATSTSGSYFSPVPKGHQRDYAYYRCVGTDAYRFGGHRICDNLQVRTDRLDELVWQQVVELLKHPERLKSEYERRLDMMERNEKSAFDTSNLEKQRLQLEKGKSRLIDSYADGILDKSDFEPKMQQLRNRLEQIDQQILESRQQGGAKRAVSGH